MADKKVRLTNTTAHVKHISIGGGKVITLPPVEPGGPGIEVTFDTDDERAAFDKAIAMPAVKTWFDNGEIVLGDRPAAAQPSQQPADPNVPTQRTAAEPATVKRRDTDRDK